MIITGLAVVLALLSGQVSLVRGQLSEPLEFDGSLVDLPGRLEQAYLGSLDSQELNKDTLADELLWRLSNLNGIARSRREDINDQDSSYVDDVNSHLPARGDYGRHLSSPVNDPAEFEAAMGQLTDELNHELPNSVNRSLALDRLLANVFNYYYNSAATAGEDEDVDNNELEPRARQVADEQASPSELISRISNLLAASAASQRDQDDDQDDDQQQQQLDSQTTSSSRYGGSEYIDHPLALAGHQYVQGGAGEGRQLLGPEGTFENVQVVKSDHAVPSYCDPPNPCPLGFTAADGCLEDFVNSASFSREYQAKQQCSCDNEHSLFNCAVGPSASLKNQHVEASPSDEPSGRSGSDDDDEDGNSASKLNILARTIQNRFGDLQSVQNLVAKQQSSVSKRKDLD